MVRYKKSETIVKMYVEQYFKECLLAFTYLHERETSITIKTVNEEFTRTPAGLEGFEILQVSERKE